MLLEVQDTGITSMLGENLKKFVQFTGFANATWGNVLMILIGLVFITLAIKKKWEPLLLIPIGFGMIIGNIPLFPNLGVGIYEKGSVYNILYQGVQQGFYPPLIFLGIGAMTDFSALISNPKLMLIGAAAQFGIFGAYSLALTFGFSPAEAGAIGIIGGADGPTAIFLSSRLAPDLLGAIAVSAYSYMALVPVIQPPIMRLLTTKKERLIRMKPPREVSPTEKRVFPIVGFLMTAMTVPSALPLLGMLFFGNLLKESGVTRRLAETARGPLIDIVTILIGLTVGCSSQADKFLQFRSVLIFLLGAGSFIIATTTGVLFVKLFNIFLKPENKINPLIGNAGVSAVPDSARVSNNVGLEYDSKNYLLMHAMGPNVSGVIGSAVAAGILLGFLG
ncbi:MAG: sodium ion-translocating decarboxylase subunit beta [Bacteroidales bacterium]|jgi:oxaloacetate decarboxylase beta subunit|nr:sodium ion-translocating decarboxylase subunit beta [Bacteroidales bacterium]